jgi:hypothetical protein
MRLSAAVIALVLRVALAAPLSSNNDIDAGYNPANWHKRENTVDAGNNPANWHKRDDVIKV